MLELTAASRQRRRDVRPRGHRGGKYPLLRAALCVVVRDVIVGSVLGDMMKGRPAVYATFSSYDEVAHHSGLEREDTVEALRKLDQQFERIARARRYAPRPYSIVVLSDHGQTQGATFLQRNGYALHDLVLRSVTARDVAAVGGGDENQTAVGSAVAEATGAKQKRAKNDVSGEEVIVLASGNLGLVYLMDEPRRLTLEEIDALHPDLIPALRSHPHIGWLLVRSEADGPVVLGPTGAHYLAGGSVTGDDPLAGFSPNAASAPAAHGRLRARRRHHGRQLLRSRARAGLRVRGADLVPRRPRRTADAAVHPRAARALVPARAGDRGGGRAPRALRLAHVAAGRIRRRRMNRRIITRVVLLLVAAGSLYLLLPKVLDVFSSWPQLRGIDLLWLALAVFLEALSYISLWTLQRITIGTRSWFAVGTSQLAANAAGSIVPGGGAAAGALQYGMLVRAGIRGDRIISGLTASTAATTAAVFALPVVASIAGIGGAAAPDGLKRVAYIGAAAFVLLGVVIVTAFLWDRPLVAVARGARTAAGWVHRRAKVEDLPERLLGQRDGIRAAVRVHPVLAALAALGKWGFDYVVLISVLQALSVKPDPVARPARVCRRRAARVDPADTRRPWLRRGRADRAARRRGCRRRRRGSGDPRIPARFLLAAAACRSRRVLARAPRVSRRSADGRSTDPGRLSQMTYLCQAVWPRRCATLRGMNGESQLNDIVLFDIPGLAQACALAMRLGNRWPCHAYQDTETAVVGVFLAPERDWELAPLLRDVQTGSPSGPSTT